MEYSRDQVNRCPGRLITLVIVLFMITGLLLVAWFYLLMRYFHSSDFLFVVGFYGSLVISPILMMVAIIINLFAKNTPAKLSKQRQQRGA